MNNCCVYLHRRKDNNEIFYIGEGSSRRPYASCTYTRSKKWLSTVALAGGFIVEIYKENISKSEAQNIEKDLLLSLPNLINSKSNTQPLDISKNDIKIISSCVKYDQNSPSGIIWIKGRNSRKHAGTLRITNNKEYWKVVINKRVYSIHRLILLLNGFELTKYDVVNHINGDGSDNRLSNLEICSQQQNMRNVNTRNSDHQGVSFNTKHNSWVARWQLNGKQIMKSYSVNKYGYEEAFNLALDCRNKNI